MQRAERLGKLIHGVAVNVFDETAVAADRVMVMVSRLAEHVCRLALSIGACRDVAFEAQPLERAVNGRKRNRRAGEFKPLVNFRRGKKARFALKDGSNPLARSSDVIGSNH